MMASQSPAGPAGHAEETVIRGNAMLFRIIIGEDNSIDEAMWDTTGPKDGAGTCMCPVVF
jgi:hypothetical protein